ncbi:MULTISPECIES: substrate-binding domain-containing protein [Rhodomicrobium]|uniref:PstS family phosphate ABC transporter substrate-binding protein n=1 Tax=Rhodomicrobium TaxID=1068 RepID=UPI001FD998DC|nr:MULTISPECIES: substrate-binding domain-containing protein [Rhodomicrobium]
MKPGFIALAAATAAAASLAASPAFARDEVKVAGSSTALPYAKIVAEQFQKGNSKFKVIVESGGSGAGINQFCKGVGPEFIDIANSSRPIKPSELEACAAAGVKDVVEVKFGYDGIVFASDVKGPDFKFEPKDWFLALAPEVVVDGKLVANPNTKWNQINPAFPDWEIAAYIPGEKHGTREVFEEKVLGAGCKATGTLAALTAKLGDEKKAEKACLQVRKDDGGKHAVDIDGDYPETLARIDGNKTGIGVFGLFFFENNADKLRVATMGGIKPSQETIASGKYPVSRPLFYYIKKAHVGVIPGLKEYANFFVSDKVIGADGPLVENGLVPLPDAEAKAVRETVDKLTTMGAKS